MTAQHPSGGEDDPGGAGPPQAAGNVEGSQEQEADELSREAESSGTLEKEIEEAKQRARELKPEGSDQ